MAKYTEAQAKSIKKYLSKFEEIKIRLSAEEKKQIEENARACGKSVNQYLKDLGLQDSEQ